MVRAGMCVCVGGCGSLRQLRSFCRSDGSFEYCRGVKYEDCIEDYITYRNAIERVELEGMVEVDFNHRHRIPPTVWEVHSCGQRPFLLLSDPQHLYQAR